MRMVLFVGVINSLIPRGLVMMKSVNSVKEISIVPWTSVKIEVQNYNASHNHNPTRDWTRDASFIYDFVALPLLIQGNGRLARAMVCRKWCR